MFVWNACNNVECSTGVIYLDPWPNKLINCESINADLDIIYLQIYWECVFSFSKERQNPRLVDCLKGKWRRSKVSYIQKEIFRQTQFPIWGCLSVGQTTDGVQHRDLLSHFQFCWPQDPNIVCLLWCQGGFQPRQTQYQISTLNKRVQSELGVPLIPGTIQ